MNITSGQQLRLTIENETCLPDGGPISIAVSGQRGLDIGRDQHLDWTLPDPSRHISSKHCEIRFRDGGYWLYDVSTNGTFLNGREGRLQAPHRLHDGDRVQVGHYIIAVAVDGDDAEAPPQTTTRPAAPYDLWRAADDAAPPLDPAERRAAADRRPLHADFLDWSIDVAAPDWASDSAPAHQDTQHEADDLSWARGASSALPPDEPTPAVPAPRRPIWVSSEPAGLWGAPQPAVDGARPGESLGTAASASSTNDTATNDTALPAAASRDDVPKPSDVVVPIAADFVRLVAQGARVPETVFTQDAGELAQQLGGLVRLVVDNVTQLLNARLQAKRLARTSSHTMIQALDNNPLKFSPTVDDALRLMFGSASAAYLSPLAALQQSFEDLKVHQVSTYTAMQQALSKMIADLDPDVINKETEVENGIAGVIRSRKAQLWDAYLSRWRAKTHGQTTGMVDLFMLHFGECYDQSGSRK
jgi:type VI secretion system protein ImpI